MGQTHKYWCDRCQEDVESKKGFDSVDSVNIGIGNYNYEGGYDNEERYNIDLECCGMCRHELKVLIEEALLTWHKGKKDD